MYILGGDDDAARDAFSAAAGRLRFVIVGRFVYYNGFTDYVARLETVGKEQHFCSSSVGEQNGKIARVVAMYVIAGIPVYVRVRERLIAVRHAA